MKKIFITALAVTSIFAFVSCSEDFDSINTSPNLPENVLSSGLFNNANKQIMDGTRGGFSSGRMFLPWVQYSAQRNYTPEDRFQFRQEVNSSLYRDIYLAAKNYRTIIELNTNPKTSLEMAKYGNLENQIAAARIMLSYSFLQLVDMYGDIPYYSYGNPDPDFQALQLEDKEILMPKFASQTKIYTDILKELKESVAMIDTAEPLFTEGDQLFGNPEKLKRFANSLRLRIATRVKGVIPTAAADITDAIASGVMQSNDDTVGVTYQKDDVLPSPFYSSYFIGSTRNDFSVSSTMVDLLKGDRGIFGLDPRLQKYVAPNTASIGAIKNQTYQESDDLTVYKGMPYGIPDAMTSSQRANASGFSYNVIKQDYTEIFMEYAEVEFLLSENNGWNQQNYENGVKASMERWKVDPAKITTFVGALPAASQANVLNQKYVALFMQPVEAWAEYRRTGFPNTLLLPGQTANLINPYQGATTYVFTPLVPLTEMPARATYPVSVQTLNRANYDAASQNIGGDFLTTKLIWDLN